MRILWLSWRDIKNPTGGGAEKVAIEVASRFVQDGAKVTIFTSRFKNSKSKEIFRGVTIVRKGNLVTCRFWAFLYYLRHRGFDLIIDEINTIPFFSIFYAPNKSFPLIHQLAKEYWFVHTFWPIGKIGNFIEPYVLKLYKNRPTLTLSQSTKLDLVGLGFSKLSIYRIGLDFIPVLPPEKDNLVLFVGRLTPAKKAEDAIDAFAKIKEAIGDINLKIIGQGSSSYVASLRQKVVDLGLKKSVSFEGFVSEKTKLTLLKRAKVVLIPAVREGWNLVATEANAAGAVPVGYDVAGLRDSILNGKNGILVNNPGQLANEAIKILKSDSKRTKLAKAGYNFAKKFSWENSFADFFLFISKHAGIRKSANFFRILLAVAILGFSIRLVFSLLLPLDGFDETYDIVIARKPIYQMIQSVSSFYPPTWHLILHFFEKLTENYTILRLLPVILGSFSVVVAGYLGKRLFSNKVGLLSAAIFALSPTQIYYSSILRLYSFSIFVSLLIFLAFENFVRRDCRRSKILLLLTLTVGMYTYYLFPILYVCFALYLFLTGRFNKLRRFLLILIISTFLALPVFLNILDVEKGSSNILPSITFLKVISIIPSFSFPLNLAQLTGLYPYFKLNFINFFLLLFAVFSIVILLKSFSETKKKLMLTIPLLAAPAITVIFSFNIVSVFGLRSLLIFSIPYYLLIASALGSNKFWKIYVFISVISVGLILNFFVQNRVSAVGTFIEENLKEREIILHSEITSFAYFSYLYPQFNHFAAIDSLYTNKTNKEALNYTPVKNEQTSGKTLWLIEYPNEIHKAKIESFKQQIQQTHFLIHYQPIEETFISKYEPK